MLWLVVLFRGDFPGNTRVFWRNAHFFVDIFAYKGAFKRADDNGSLNPNRLVKQPLVILWSRITLTRARG